MISPLIHRRMGESYLIERNVTADTTVFTPAANTDGVILRHFAMQTNNAPIVLFADTAAPTGYTDTSKRAIFSGEWDQNLHLNYDLFIPAGLGLYITSFNARYGTIGWDNLA